MPDAKNGERPYLAVPEPVFPGLFFGLFCPIFIRHYVVSPASHTPSASFRATTQQHPINILWYTPLSFITTTQLTFHKNKRSNKILAYDILVSEERYRLVVGAHINY